MKKILKFALLLVVLLIAYLANHYGLLQKTLEWLKSAGPLAPFAFVGVYALACVFFVPSFVFTFSAGALFGMWGVPLALAGAGLGSTAALLIGRYLARGLVAKNFESNKNFKVLEAALSKKGWQIIILARLSPIFPFLVGNYAFGLTPVSAWSYGLASMLGSIPSTAVYVYLGSITGSLANAAGRTRSPLEWALLIAGLIATVLLTVVIQRAAKRALEEKN